MLHTNSRRSSLKEVISAVLDTAMRAGWLVGWLREPRTFDRPWALARASGPPPAEAAAREREGLAGGLRGEEERTGPGRSRPCF